MLSVRSLKRSLSIRYASYTSRQPPRTSSTTSSTSNVQTKLNYFLQTGQITKYSPRQVSRKQDQKSRVISKSYEENYSLQKALLILKANYDSSIFQDSEGQVFKISTLSSKDLAVSSPKSLEIFRNLDRIRKTTKKNVDKRLLLTLLGTNERQLKDPFVVSSDVLKLLERDGETTRALSLIRFTKGASSESSPGIVGINIILQWLLERGETKEALKCLNDRKKWMIPLNSYTYVILFNGLCNSHEWGKVSNEVCEYSIDLFNKYREESANEVRPRGQNSALGKCGIEHFNSLLSVLVKNFHNEQEFAWSIFDTLGGSRDSEKKRLPVLVPNSQTFTIFLNGIKKYHTTEASTITNNPKLSQKEKTVLLLKNHNQLIQTANAILDKVLKSSVPPVPPTKEDAEHDPELLNQYRIKMNRILLTIDPNFVSVFVSCYINNFAGTGADMKSGSHYKYVQQGLGYMKIWSPEIDKMLESVRAGSDPTSPSKSVKFITDSRIRAVSEASEDLVADLPELDRTALNPDVVFPPSPFSKNKTRAIFSDKKKPLVDFTRLTYDEVQTILLDKQFKDSRGKYGKKMPADAKLTRNMQKDGVNKFLIMNVLDGLIKLGKHKEFVLSIWYILRKWGGLKLEEEEILKLAKGSDFLVLAEDRYPKFIKDQKELAPTEKTSKTYNENIVDIQLVENLIYKLNENFKEKGLSATNTIVEIFSALVNPEINVANGLVPRFKTVDVIFSSLMTDLHYYNDFSYNQQAKKKEDERKIPFKSISKDQLAVFLPTLARFMDSLLVFESQKSKQERYLLPNMYMESYNRIVARLLDTTWIELTNDEKVQFHKHIIRSGILMYKPREFIDPREKLQYSTILRSLQVFYTWFKDNKGLSKEDVRLGNSIKSLFSLKKSDTDAEDKLKSILKSIYRHS